MHLMRIGAPLARPHQILCVGLNYRNHAAERGMAVPDEPILFTTSSHTLAGPNDDVRIPRGSVKTDCEVELGIVIGRRTGSMQLQGGGAMSISRFRGPGIRQPGTRRQHVLGPR